MQVINILEEITDNKTEWPIDKYISLNMFNKDTWIIVKFIVTVLCVN